MYINYDKNTDYLEFFIKKTRNYADFQNQNEAITEFRDEKNNSIVGFGIDNASMEIFSFNKVDPVDKLALVLKVSRINSGLTQEDLSKKLNISLRHCQRLESGQDTTVSLLSDLMGVFPDVDFKSIFDSKKSA